MEPLVGRWPWPRLMHATVIDYLAAAGAKVIGYDVLFAERDIRKFMVGDTEWTGEESDAALVESTKKAGNVVHIAEASSPELADPSRALKREPRRAGAERAPCPTWAAPNHVRVVTPPFPALARRVARHRPFAVHARCRRRRCGASRRSCRSAIARFRRSRWRRRSPPGTTPVDRRARIDDTGHCTVMIPWRGPGENRNGQPTFTSYSFYDVFYSQQQISKGRSRASIRRSSRIAS